MATVNALSAEQIAVAARAGGFPQSEVPIAVAIALAESGGRPNAHNATPPDDSYGLWQINMLGSLGPARRAEFQLTSNTQLFDPVTNARAAYAIRRKQGWIAWSVYTNGKYRQHLPSTQRFANSIPLLPIPDIAIEGGIAVGEALEAPIKWLNAAMLRVAMFVGGGLLILAAIVMMAIQGQDKVLGVATKAVTKTVAPARKFSKAVKGAKR